MVVGVGASAGGVSALKAFFSNYQPTPHSALILIQHMEMTGGALALETLNQLAPVECIEIADGLDLQAGRIYFAPPHGVITLNKNVFSVQMATGRLERQTLLDRLFVSLAESRTGSSVVGVILSGEGSDGARGLKVISDNGGMTIAQAPETAEHPAMPHNAISTGIIDHVLKPEEISAELAAYEKYLERLTSKNQGIDLQAEIDLALPAICEALLKFTKHDFKHYKASTLIRRIQRRMQVLQLNSVESYLVKLNEDSAEVGSLFKELLINVTSFFRDPDAFEALRDDVLKRLIHGRPTDQKIRVWVAGCSTGEEAYSLAIILHEVLGELTEKPEIQIIATDIDEAALNIARKGSYPLGISEHVSPSRLQRYFVRKGGRYHIVKEIRELCLFSCHNLINDPPFSQVDLISCRNLMIYLGPHLQAKLIPVFHYALKNNGFLFLGTSESLMGHKELFKTISAKNRIAQRKSTAIQISGSFANLFSSTYGSPLKGGALTNNGDLHLVSQRIILDEFAPKYAVVNEDCQVVSVSAGIESFLAPSEGQFHNNITKLVDTQLRVALRSALNQAKQYKRRVDHDSATMKTNSGFRRIGVTVQPMPQLGEDSSLYMVIFRDLGPIGDNVTDGEAQPGPSANLALVEQLETELTSVRDDLDKTVQDLEASNEELKSSNEELLSMNEELQAANEELEASKDEVQASNDALQNANTDLENLLDSTEIATLFLDDHFRIRNFTPAISEVYYLVNGDLGRSINHFNHTAVNMPDYPDQKLFSKTQKVIEEEITLVDGRRMLRRISPYRNHDGKISGIVVTFINVTAMREAEERYRLATEASKVGIWDWNLLTNRIHWLAHKDIMFGPSTSEPKADPAEDELFENFRLAIYSEDRDRITASFKKAIQSGSAFHEEYRVQFPNGEVRWVESRGQVFSTERGEPIRFLGTNLDRTEQKVAEDRLKASENRFRQLAEGMPQLTWISDAQGRVTYLSQKWYAYTGLKEGSALGSATWHSAIHPDDRDRVLDAWNRAMRGEASYRTEYRLRSSVGEFRWFLAWGTPIYDQEGRILQWFGTCTDIQNIKNAESGLANSEREFRALANAIPNLAWIAEPDGSIFWYNDRWYEYTGTTPEEMHGWGWQKVHDPQILPIVMERWKNSLQTGQALEMEFPLKSRRGDYRWFLTRVHPLKDSDGQVLRWFGTNTDVHEQLQTRRALEESEERYRLLTELSPQAIWTADPQGQINYVNQHWFELTGRNAGETLGHQWTQFVSEDDRERMQAAWDNGLAYRQAMEIEVRLPHRQTGQVRWVLMMARPVFDDQGQILRWVGIAHDVESRKQTEFENEVLAKASVILASSLDYKANLQKLIQLLVEYFGEWSWVQLYDSTGTLKHTDLFTKRPDKDQALRDLAMVIRGNQGNALEAAKEKHDVVIRNGLDDYYYQKVSSTPDELKAFRSLAPRCVLLAPLVARGFNYGYLAIGSCKDGAAFGEREANILRSLSEKISNAIDNSLLFEEAQVANSTKTTFLANVSHEIRTPLGAIMGFTDLLQHTLPKEKTSHDYLERISRNAKQLGRLIDELLDLSKIEADRLDIEQLPFDLKVLIDEATSTLAFKAQENGLEFRCLWNSPIPNVVISDPNRIRQIIINLLSNSIKFTRRGHVELSVSLEEQAEAGYHLSLRVSDTGVGLSQDEQRRLFRPFTQADNSITRKFGGTGLGLALSKKLTNLLGGDLVIESSVPGQGTSFLATLPIQLPNQGSSSPSDTSPRECTWASDSLSSKRILIVEDSPDNQLIIMQYLDQLGAKYATADNGLIAVEMCQRESFDLILMDVQMPLMDGFAALKMIRAQGFAGPIMALTAHAMRGEREKCLDAGFTEYLSKPIRREDLFIKLHAMLKIFEHT